MLDEPLFATVGEVADLLRSSKGFVWSQIKAGHFRYVKIGDLGRLPLDQFKELAAGSSPLRPSHNPHGRKGKPK